MPRQPEALILRSVKNPILTARDWPYPAHTIFNPGAVRLKDGSTLLLARVEDFRGISHLTVARSVNGVDGWMIDCAPTFSPDPENHREELWGIEDPRITYIPDQESYFIAYTAFSQSGPGVAIASTTDFVNFERHGLVMQPDDKDAALFPRTFDGNYVLIHRPMTGSIGNLWISRSPDMVNWGSHQVLIPARRGAWWDAGKIGLCTPPIETPRGWLILYHGVRVTAAGALYRVGLALLDLEHPDICILRGSPWMFGPAERYELEGDVGKVVFPCGYTVGDDGDTLNIYYGAADTSIALATASIKQLLEWLDENGTSMVGVAGQPMEINDQIEPKSST
jgi:predicted GH43/DUF377 family glycosyl hydrolase